MSLFLKMEESKCKHESSTEELLEVAAATATAITANITATPFTAATTATPFTAATTANPFTAAATALYTFAFWSLSAVYEL